MHIACYPCKGNDINITPPNKNCIKKHMYNKKKKNIPRNLCYTKNKDTKVKFYTTQKKKDRKAKITRFKNGTTNIQAQKIPSQHIVERGL